jgi:Flp pilus assembly protein CpaB
MTTTTTKTRSPGARLRRTLSTRRGTLAVAGVCALTAAAVLMVFLSRYKDSVSEAAAPTPVLVATSLIQKGTSGDIIAEKRQFETVTRAAEDIKEGALTDPGLLAGKVTTADIYPGQQITDATFAASTGTVLPKLADDERAIAVPVDEVHGLVGQVQTGDHVDLLASYSTSNSATGQGQGIVKTLLQDKLVLRAGAQPIEGSNEGEADKSVIVRVTDREAVTLAHAGDNGRVWVLLRPAAGAKQSRPYTATLDSVMSGSDGPARFKATIKKQGNTVTVTGGPTR